MREMMYILNGDPIPLARARYGNRRVWDSQAEIKLIASLSLANQHGENPLFKGPLSMDIIFFIQLPHNTHKYKQKLGDYHRFRPDLDNMIKFICDISNSIIYKDDCIISQISAKKVYDTEPHTQFIIREL